MWNFSGVYVCGLVVVVFFCSDVVRQVDGVSLAQLDGTANGGATGCSSVNEVWNPFTHKCVSCTEVCSEENSQYDAQMCNSSCTVYHLQEEVSVLRILASVSIAITAACILSLICVTIYFWRKRLLCFEDNGHRGEKAYALGLFPPTTGSSDATLPAPLPRGMPCPSITRDEHSPPIKSSPAPSSVSARIGMTRAFRREPSESTTPEFAYDNPALAPSPSHSQGAREDPIMERRTQTEL